MNSFVISEERKTIVELSPEEISMYQSEKKENLIILKTVVSGKKNSGKSTLICSLLVFLSKFCILLI